MTAMTKAQAELELAKAKAAQAKARAKGAAANAEMKVRANERDREKRDRELAANEVNHVYVFDKAVSDATVKVCIAQLTAWSRLDPGCAIEIQVSSPGGSIFDGFHLIDYIRGLRAEGHEITMVGLGMVASMAGVLMQAASKRVMGENSFMLIHEGCELPNAQVLTPDLDIVSHGDLEVGMPVLGFDEHARAGLKRRYRQAEVMAAGRAVKPCYEIKLEDGTTHVVTGDHLWLTKQGGMWQTTEGLNRNLWVGPTRVQSLLPIVRQEWSWESGWMAGLLDGEGCVSRSPVSSAKRGQAIQVRITQTEGAVLDHARQWLDARGFTYCDSRTEAGYYNPNASARHQLTITGGLREQARLLMLTRPKRLLNKMPDLLDGSGIWGKPTAVADVSPVGRQEVVTLRTSTRTYVGSGLAMHNSLGAIGDFGDVEDKVKLMEQFHARILTLFEERAKPLNPKTTKAFIKNRWSRKDWWFPAADALKHGFIDEVR